MDAVRGIFARNTTPDSVPYNKVGPSHYFLQPYPREDFGGRGCSSERAAGGCQSESCSETLRMQQGEEGVGRKNNGSIV